MFAEITKEDLRAFGLLELADAILPAVRPAAHFFYTRVPTLGSSQRSWFGGAPSLPPDLPWPEAAGGPLTFVAQLDCAELAGIVPELALPDTGQLVFFAAATAVFDGQFPGLPTRDYCRVHYLPAGTVTTTHPPVGPQADDFFGQNFHLLLSRRDTLPAETDTARFHAVFGDRSWEDALGSRARYLLSLLNDVGSREDSFGRIGGYPSFLQDASLAALDNEPPELLLQFRDGSDGHSYFLIRAADLANRAFDRVEFYHDYM